MFKKLGWNRLKEILTLGDKIVMLVIVLVSISMLVLTPVLIVEAGANKQVVITLKDQELYRYRLEDNPELKKIDFSFEVENKEYQGVLQMKEGKVKLERLSEDISPLPIHSEMGWISEPYQMIVSLPVQLAVTVEVKGETESDLDIVSF